MSLFLDEEFFLYGDIGCKERGELILNYLYFFMYYYYGIWVFEEFIVLFFIKC